MKHMLNIRPFDEFWFDCITNNYISILSSFEESYKYAMYQNDYNYENEININIYRDSKKHTISSKGLQINNNVIDQLVPYINIEEKKYINKDKFLDEIKELLYKNTIILPAVDLYFWNKIGLFHHKIHANHYTLLIGFDDDKKEFYALEDDIHRNYKMITESESTFIESVQSNHCNNEISDYLIFTISESLPKYRLPLHDIVHNIPIINKSLHSLNFDDLYTHKYDNKEFSRLSVLLPRKISKIIVRQQANISLINILHKKNIISTKDYILIVNICEDIIKIWQIINNHIRKATLLNVDYLNQKADTLIRLSEQIVKNEIDCWNHVKTAIVNSKIPLDTDLVI